MKDTELRIDKCPIKENMEAIIEKYIKTDGYMYTSPA